MDLVADHVSSSLLGDLAALVAGDLAKAGGPAVDSFHSRLADRAVFPAEDGAVIRQDPPASPADTRDDRSAVWAALDLSLTYSDEDRVSFN